MTEDVALKLKTETHHLKKLMFAYRELTLLNKSRPI